MALAVCGVSRRSRLNVRRRSSLLAHETAFCCEARSSRSSGVMAVGSGAGALRRIDLSGALGSGRGGALAAALSINSRS